MLQAIGGRCISTYPALHQLEDNLPPGWRTDREHRKPESRYRQVGNIVFPDDAWRPRPSPGAPGARYVYLAVLGDRFIHRGGIVDG